MFLIVARRTHTCCNPHTVSKGITLMDALGARRMNLPWTRLRRAQGTIMIRPRQNPRRGRERVIRQFACVLAVQAALFSAVVRAEAQETPWEFSLTPYLWLPRVDASMRTRGCDGRMRNSTSSEDFAIRTSAPRSIGPSLALSTACRHAPGQWGKASICGTALLVFEAMPSPAEESGSSPIIWMPVRVHRNSPGRHCLESVTRSVGVTRLWCIAISPSNRAMSTRYSTFTIQALPLAHRFASNQRRRDLNSGPLAPHVHLDIQTYDWLALMHENHSTLK
jgi:hypothetical protein